MPSCDRDIKHPLSLHRCLHCAPFDAEIFLEAQPTKLFVHLPLRREFSDLCLFARFAIACVRWVEAHFGEVALVRMDRDGLIKVENMRDSTRANDLVFECLQLPDGHDRGNDFGGDAWSLEKRDVMRMLPAATSSEESFEAISRWLQECCSGHTECPKPLMRYPDGILQDIRFLCIDNESIRLTEDMRPLRYAALSHCWGSGADVLKTTTQNLSEYTNNGISSQSLPKTFQDTIEVCRRMEIRYLWIDSLCIIQDSPQDWRIQASRMAEIYQNAYLTIAASKAHDSSQGCFAETHWSYRGAMLPGFPSIAIRRLCIPPGTDFRPDGNHDDWPIYSRAWIYQELVLSPRVVHFGEELMWHCTRRAKCAQSMTNKFDKVLARTSKFKRFTEEGFQRQWYRTIEAYSWRELTYWGDKLPAIAAIAEQRQNLRPEDQYLAGLWRDTLLLDLLWYVKDGDEDADGHWYEEDDQYEDEDEYQARATSEITDCNVPSWSWASICYGVHWLQCSSDEPLRCVRILKTTFTTDGPLLSGAILTAQITLHTPAIPLHRLRIYDPGPSPWNAALPPPPESQPLELVIGEFKYDNDCEAEGSSGAAPNTYGIPLSNHRRLCYGTDLEIPGLMMLLVVETGRQGEYRRLGLVSLALAGSFHVWRDDSDDAHAKQKEYWRLLIERIESLETRDVVLV